MLSSSNPQISSIHPTPALSLISSISFTSSISFDFFTSSSCLAHSLPIFSTPSKHRAHTSARNSIPFMRLLHSSLFTHIPHRLLPSNLLLHSGPLFPLHPIPLAPLTPFLVYPEPRRVYSEPPRSTHPSPINFELSTLNLFYKPRPGTLPTLQAVSCELSAVSSLSPFPATLTRPVTPNSFICRSYKKHPGVGHPPVPKLLCATSAPSAPKITFRPSPPTRESFLLLAVGCELLASTTRRSFLFTSLPHYFFTSPHETLSSPPPSHPMQAVPCGGSIKNQTGKSQIGGDCA